ncbi:hypothetical protein APSETT445_001841 [Aspergillus pseudonomiae]
MGISDHGFGQEGAGVVTKVGAEVKNLQPGDRVLFMVDPGKTAFGNYVRVDRRFIAVMPSGMSMGVAAALPTAFSTVIYSLKHAGVLRAGERILIHAAAGGVGQAAIQYAKLLGAEVFATVSSKAKKELLMKVYGIAEDHIFSSRELSFATGVMRLTKNQGVDMILNSCHGEPLRRSWECIAPFGRFVEIGNIDLIADKFDMSPFLRSASITGVELTVIMEYKPDVIKNILEEVVSSWNQGKICLAQPLTVLSFAQLEHGFKQLRSGQNMGKIVFQPRDSDIIPVAPIIAPPYTLDANATYVLAGGLGGAGRSLAEWMALRGAKHIVFLSRSGRVNRKVEEMTSFIARHGCEYRIFKVDITKKAQLMSVFTECREKLPPIKGCIQCSMVLEDVIFETMTYENWQGATEPKIIGSLNLYEALPRPLNFFIMIASASGIVGNRGQANYAVGNTFQDAFARHLVKNGQRAATIDLSFVTTVGYSVELPESLTRHIKSSVGQVEEEEIHALVDDPQEHQQTEHNKDYNPSALLSAAQSREIAAALTQDAIQKQLAYMIIYSEDDIDSVKSIKGSEVDSIVAMELRTWLVKELGADITMTDMMTWGSLADLSESVVNSSKFVRVSK